MPANPSGDDDTPVRGKEPVPAEVDPASPETRAAERGRSPGLRPRAGRPIGMAGPFGGAQHLVDEAFGPRRARSEEHTSELQSLMGNSYAVLCLEKKTEELRYERMSHTRLG